MKINIAVILNASISLGVVVGVLPQAFAARSVKPVTCGSSWTNALNKADQLSTDFQSYAAQTGVGSYVKAGAYHRMIFKRYLLGIRNATTSEACTDLFKSLVVYNDQMEQNVADIQLYLSQLAQPSSSVAAVPSSEASVELGSVIGVQNLNVLFR